MNVALLVVTIVALAAATGFGGLALLLHQENRRRSVARVSSLAAAIDAETALPPGASVRVSPLFRASALPLTRGSHFIKPVAIGAMAVTLVVAIVTGAHRVPVSRPAPAVSEVAPLELVSMDHVRERGTLTVSGVLRNPVTGTLEGGLIALVFAYDRGGHFLGSGRAPIDMMTLQPGDESQFAVSLPNVDNVGRYRVSFRNDRGLVRHLDRRPERTPVTASLRQEGHL